ncbi:MAG TPA: O-antigen ligase family protein, partial [Solirubrobacteraceae bacterium]|nr:O-antigen ligase family protein [Solirubrobacteraceae bacterium]
MAACAYAVFAHGASGLPEEPRLQIGVALIAVAASVGWLFSGSLRLRAPAIVWVGVALLGAFAVWCAITLAWSVAPDRTWGYINRSVAYTLLVVLAIAAASSAPKVIERIAWGWLAIALATALYALAGKVMPGAEILGVSFNHTAVASRLRAPLEYWNALALVMVLAVPIALRLASDDTRRERTRMFGITALFLLLLVLGMTYSRGGLVAFAVALTVVTVLGREKLRGLAIMGVTIVATIPVLGLAFSRPALKAINVPLSERTPDGIVLGLVLAGSIVGLLIAAWGLLRLEERTKWSDENTQLVWRGLAATGAVVALLALGGIATADGGPSGFAHRAWHEFSKTSKDDVSNPARIISSNSGNRWVWWEEAAGAWWAKPLGGWGAGSFPVTHKLYRKVELGVAQPHNVPLQFLAETGLVGAILAMTGVGLLLWAALARVRSMAPGREREIAIALFAGALAWLVHGLVDWDWDIPGVTIPALIFLGVLGGVRAPARTGAWRPEWSTGARALALALACVVLGLSIVSSGLPLVADSKASSALAVSNNAGDAELENAAAQADLASRLDPTAVRALLAAAAIEQGRGRFLDAKRYLLAAVHRQPYSSAAWERLLRLTLQTADRPGAQAAAARLLQLDPIGSGSRALAAQLTFFRAPAGSSPTATGTPLSPAYNAAATAAPAPGLGRPRKLKWC